MSVLPMEAINKYDTKTMAAKALMNTFSFRDRVVISSPHVIHFGKV